MSKEERKHLAEIGFYLEGIKEGKGNILPLGSVHLKSLWSVVSRTTKN